MPAPRPRVHYLYVYTVYTVICLHIFSRKINRSNDSVERPSFRSKSNRWKRLCIPRWNCARALAYLSRLVSSEWRTTAYPPRREGGRERMRWGRILKNSECSARPFEIPRSRPPRAFLPLDPLCASFRQAPLCLTPGALCIRISFATLATTAIAVAVAPGRNESALNVQRATAPRQRGGLEE